MERLGEEIRLIILSQLTRTDLVQCCRLNRSYNKLVQSMLFHSIELSNSKQVVQFLSNTATSTNHTQCLTLTSTAINNKDLIKLLSKFNQLTSLTLQSTSISNLRRSELNSLGSSTLTLTSLAINSSTTTATSTGFNLHTLGLILIQLPQLLHLHLNNLNSFSTALIGIKPPTFRLISLTLIIGINNQLLTLFQFNWLYNSTTFFESLRSLTLEWNHPNASARLLNGIRYLGLRVTHFKITSNQIGTIESFLLHFPSLIHLKLNSEYRVNSRRLLENLDHPLLSLVDYSSPSKGRGINSGELASLLQAGKKLPINLRELKLIRLGKAVGESCSSTKELEKVCKYRGIKLDYISDEDVEE